MLLALYDDEDEVESREGLWARLMISAYGFNKLEDALGEFPAVP